MLLARAAAASRALKEAAWDGYGKGERFAWDGETVDEFGAVHTSETQNWPIDVSECRLTLARHKRLDALFRGRDNDDSFYFCATCYAANRDGSPRELPGPWPGDARLSANLDLPVLKGGGLAAEDVAFLVSLDGNIPPEPVVKHGFSQPEVVGDFTRISLAVVHFDMNDHRRLRSGPGTVLRQEIGNYNF